MTDGFAEIKNGCLCPSSHQDRVSGRWLGVGAITLVILVLTLGGCGPVMQTRVMDREASGSVGNWQEGIRRTASVGEMMTSSKPSFVYQTLNLERQIAVQIFTRRPLSSRQSGEITLAAGHYLLEGSDNEGRFFGYPSLMSIHYSSGQRPERVWGGIYVPNDGLAPASLYWFSNKSLTGTTVRVVPLPESPDFALTTIEKLPDDTIGFVSTLTFGGVASGQIKFIYREYKDGLAQMAFTQEVTLDYAPGKVYAYKEARFIVHQADLTKVEYTLLKPL